MDDSNESQFWASEQFRAGVPFVAQDSHFVNPKEARFNRKQIRDWRRQADRLNRPGQGDTRRWVLAIRHRDISSPRPSGGPGKCPIRSGILCRVSHPDQLGVLPDRHSRQPRRDRAGAFQNRVLWPVPAGSQASVRLVDG